MAEWSRAELANSNDALPKPEVALGEPIADLVAPTVGAGAVQGVPEPVGTGPECSPKPCRKATAAAVGPTRARPCGTPARSLRRLA